MFFLSVATVLWKWDALNNFDENIWLVILTYLDFSACSYVRINEKKTKVLCFVFYPPASPDNPAVHGDPGEPPVYSWTGPPHTGCVSAVLCSAGLRILHGQSLVCRTLMNLIFSFFNRKRDMGMEEIFWLKLAFMCLYIKQYSTLTNSKLCKHRKPYKIQLIGDRHEVKYDFFSLSFNLVWLLTS